MRKPVALVALLVAAGAIAAGLAIGHAGAPAAPTAVIDGWPIGAPKGVCASVACAQMTRLGLTTLDERYPTHAAVLSSSLYGVGACAGPTSGGDVATTTGGAHADAVLVVALADGAVHAFGLADPGADGAPSVSPALDAPYCAAVVTGAG